MWFLLIGSIIAIGIFVERLLFYHRSSVRVDEFIKGIAALLREERYKDALERCDEAYGPAVKIIQVAILKRHLPKAELKEILQEVGQLQMPRLEANLSLLSTIGYISPLMGLLGTVIGMIYAFMEMNQSMGASPVGDLAQGIWEALITTAGGLVVAIPSYVAYNFLSVRMNAMVTDMERAGIEVLQVLYDKPHPNVEKKKPDTEVSGPDKDKKAADKEGEKKAERKKG